ncbi:MAG: PTS glucose transporter subunit IIA, partial [Lachnospiraceae bacterium]|nr:PTS glucose transporter subunit IIA [Lachnospiraceae bacterium]
LFSPIKGTIISREEIPDETFASGILVYGVGIDPETGEVVAPFDGEIVSVTDTRHAVGISGPDGMEVLIHVGIDTVNMNGDGFALFVAAGDKVTTGQKLMTFDIAKIRAAGYSTTTAVLLANSDDYPDFRIVKTGKTDVMEKVFTIS